MKVLVYYNPGAGHDRRSPHDLSSMVQRAGHELLWCEAKTDDLDGFLGQTPDVLVVAGGDGSVAKVVRHLRGAKIPIVVLPEGTANNIASALGTDDLDVDAILRDGKRVPFDLGTVRIGSKAWAFVEGVGWGAFSETVALLSSREHEPQTVDSREDELDRDLSTFRECIVNENASEYRLTIDGAEVTGKFLLIEALNIPTVGPNLPLAPAADPSDGVLDLVLVDEAEREDLVRFVEHLLRGEPVPARLPTRRCSELRVEAVGKRRLHVDGKSIKEDEEEQSAVATFSVHRQALQFLVRRRSTR